MRLVSFRKNSGTPRIGALLDDQVIDISEIGYPATMQGWFAAPPETIAQVAADLSAATFPTLDSSHIQLEAPIPTPSKIVAIGVNYLDHCREQGIDPPPQPLVFSKFP